MINCDLWLATSQADITIMIAESFPFFNGNNAAILSFSSSPILLTNSISLSIGTKIICTPFTHAFGFFLSIFGIIRSIFHLINASFNSTTALTPRLQGSSPTLIEFRFGLIVLALCALSHCFVYSRIGRPVSTNR